MEVTYTLPYTYMSGRDHSASLSVGHRCLGTQVPDRGLAEVLTSPNKEAKHDEYKRRVADLPGKLYSVLPNTMVEYPDPPQPRLTLPQSTANKLAEENLQFFINQLELPFWAPSFRHHHA